MVLPTTRDARRKRLGQRKRRKGRTETGGETHVALCILVWPGEVDRHLDIAAREAKLVPRPEHATAVRLVVVVRRLERDGRA